MNLKKYFMDLFKTLTGNVLLIGIKDQDLVEFINHKEEIKCCYLLNSEFKGKKKKAGWGLRKTPTISAKKFRKKFKKKRMDTIVCNIDDMESHFKTFIKDSIYICRGTIYLFGKVRKIEDLKLKEKYQRYHVTIEEEKVKDGKILIIHVGKAKTYRIKELWFLISDFFRNMANLMSDYLVN